MELNILKYAYIGDAAFELEIRNYLLHNENIKINELHKSCIKIVCAHSQSVIVEKLIENEELNEEEIQIYKTGRNTKTYSKSKNSNIIEYHKATGFEAMIGYLYMNDKNRFDVVIEKILKLIKEKNI